MNPSRQAAFQKLRTPCVELSSAALQFRAGQNTSQTLSRALENVYQALRPLGQAGALDEKLAEYTFFPLSTCFNETKRLSSKCLETSLRCLQILVAQAWRQKLPAATGKQLLILLTWIAGGGPGQEDRSPPSEEVLTAAFECMGSVIEQLAGSTPGKSVLDKVDSTMVVDQVTYLLLDTIGSNPVETVQKAALETLSQIWQNVSNRIVLASLLPRTVSALTNSLKSTTATRRTTRILVQNLELLTDVIRLILNDQDVQNDQGLAVSEPHTNEASDDIVLDKSWLNATTSQIKLALTQVIQLRSHDRPEVREALGKLCIMVIEECPKSLIDSLTLVTETLVVLCTAPMHEYGWLISSFKHIISSHPIVAECLKSSLLSWTTALPRVMQGNDDRPKQRLLGQISSTFEVLSDVDDTTELLDDNMVNTICESVAAAIHASKPQASNLVTESGRQQLQLLDINTVDAPSSFGPVILDHKSQQESLKEFEELVSRLSASKASDILTSYIIQRTSNSTGDSLLSAMWLSIRFLQDMSQSPHSMYEFLDLPGDTAMSRPYLVEELYSSALQHLDAGTDWRLTALTLEVVTLQASQLGASFRPELIDVLYPTLGLFGSNDSRLQEHAVIALNKIAGHLQYTSVPDMLVENVDYLINSIALKMNAFDLSPQGPQVMVMMLRLCGAKIIPYMDDLIGSIFAALDTFHGYSRLVDLLFQVLDIVVEESSKSPQLAITTGEAPDHKKKGYRPSTLDDIIEDLRARKKRKMRHDSDTDPLQAHPKRPWSSKLDGPKQEDSDETETRHEDENLEEDDSAPLPKDTTQSTSPSKAHALLLSIARATIPHLSSPSPKTRLTCLQLLTRLMPILAKDENTFLPVVNDIWDALVSRLFTSTGSWSEEEIYIQVATIDVIRATCTSAGDFMSTRIEDMFPNLEKLYKALWQRLETVEQKDKDRRSNHQPAVKRFASNRERGENTIKIHSQEPSPTSRPITLLPSSSTETPTQSTALAPSSHHLTPSISANPNTNTNITLSSLPIPTASTFHTSLLQLFTSILTFVHIQDTTSSAILEMVSPALIFYRVLNNIENSEKGNRERTTKERENLDAMTELLGALEMWNGDAVWLLRQQQVPE